MAGTTGRPTAPLVLTEEERAYLKQQARQEEASARSMSERCQIVLRCADGIASKMVAAELGIHENTVGKWRRRFLRDRVEGLFDADRSGRPRTINDDQIAAVIERTLQSTPEDGSQWSIRSMAAETGFSHTTIRRIWAAFGLQPHHSQTSRLLSDPLFIDKVCDVVGFHLAPPTARWRSASMRRNRDGCKVASNLARRQSRTNPSNGCVTLFGMARALCLQRLTSFPGSRSTMTTSVTGLQSFSTFSGRLMPASLLISMFTSSWITTRPAKLQRSGPGWRAALAIISISPRHQLHGSLRSRAGLLN